MLTDIEIARSIKLQPITEIVEDKLAQLQQQRWGGKN